MPKKKQLKLKIDKQFINYSDVQPPNRPAIEAMIKNLHKADEKSAAKIL